MLIKTSLGYSLWWAAASTVMMQTIVVALDSLGFKPHTATDAPVKMMVRMERGKWRYQRGSHSTLTLTEACRRSLGVRMKAVVVFALNKTGWRLATEFLPRVADVWGNAFNCRQGGSSITPKAVRKQEQRGDFCFLFFWNSLVLKALKQTLLYRSTHAILCLVPHWRTPEARWWHLRRST